MTATPGEVRAWSPMPLLTLCIAAGVVLFGGVQPGVTFVLVAVVMVVGGLALRGAPAGNRPDRAMAIALLLFPAWVMFQLVPLPAGLAGAISPRAAATVRDLWPGPLHGCDGALLVPAEPPRWFPLSVDPASTREFVFLVIAAAVVFAAAASRFGQDGTPRGAASLGASPRGRLLWWIAAFTAAESAYGLVQWLARTPRVLWLVKTAYLDAATGTLINRNHFAALCYVGMGCSLALLADRIREPARAHGKETAVRVTLGLVLGLQLAAILASQSRAGFVGAAIVLLAGAPALLRQRGAVRVAALAMLALVVLPTSIYVAPRLAERFAELPVEWRNPAGRGAVARLAVPMAAAYPVTGFGGGAFEYGFARFRTEKIAGLYDFAHDDYVQVLVETGLPGLVFALAPVVLFAMGAWRGWRRGGMDGDVGRFLPVYGALAALALHEFADFTLRIPALLLLVALLAGAAPSVREGRRASSRLTAVLPWAALLLAIPAALQSAARWPGALAWLPWPQSPDARFDAGARLVGDARAGRAARCSALGHFAEAQRLRPLASRYAVSYARTVVRTMADDAVPGVEALRADASRAADRALRADPWDAEGRRRLMEVSLALGELDRAASDADAAIRNSPDLARPVVKTLADVDLPIAAIAPIVGREPAAVRAVLQSAIDEEDFEGAAVLVPPDVRPDDPLCRSGWLVADVLRERHHRPADRFLEGCLALPGIATSPELPDLLRNALVRDLVGRREFDRAAAVVAQIGPGQYRNWSAADLAEARSDWKGLAEALEAIAAGPAALKPEDEGWVRYRLARAYSRDHRPAEAIAELEAARRLNPQLTDIDRLLAELRFGHDPFP